MPNASVVREGVDGSGCHSRRRAALCVVYNSNLNRSLDAGNNMLASLFLFSFATEPIYCSEKDAVDGEDR
jgi:hypothetical protein